MLVLVARGTRSIGVCLEGGLLRERHKAISLNNLVAIRRVSIVHIAARQQDLEG
jgi:hypothetical protein